MQEAHSSYLNHTPGRMHCARPSLAHCKSAPCVSDASRVVDTPIGSMQLFGVLVRGCCFGHVPSGQLPLCQRGRAPQTPMRCGWTTEGPGGDWQTRLKTSSTAHVDLSQGPADLQSAALTTERWTPVRSVFKDPPDLCQLAIVLRLDDERTLDLGTDMTWSFS